MPGTPRQRPEQILQTRIVARLRREFDALVYAVPNGGSRGRIEAVRLKEMGVVAGIPDLVACGREGMSVYLEIKAPGGDLSDAQRRIIPELQGRGFPVFTVDTVDAAVQALTEAGFGPPRPADWLARDVGGF